MFFEYMHFSLYKLMFHFLVTDDNLIKQVSRHTILLYKYLFRGSLFRDGYMYM